MLSPAKHGRDFADRLHLHARAGPATVERVVVGVDLHGECVCGTRQRMGRLEHLPRIQWMKVGEVVRQASGHLPHDSRHGCIRGLFLF